MPAPRLPSTDLGLTWRPIGDGDIDRWLDLMKAIETHDESSERQERDDLVEALHDGPSKDPNRDSLIGVDEAGTARAFGHVTTLPGATLRRVFLWGGVHPEWRERGVGRELLRWQTERARECIAEQDAERGPDRGHLPWRIAVSEDEKDPTVSALYAAAGYSPIRRFFDMVRPLGKSAAPIPDMPLPEDVELTPWTGDLDEAVRLAHNEAFAHHWGSQPRDPDFWRTSVTEHRTFRRTWSLALLDRSDAGSSERPEVVGYVASFAYPQDWEASGTREAHLGLIGIRPGWRGRRLAPALIAAAMRLYEADEMEAVGLNVDSGNTSGAPRLYERMGFGVKQITVSWGIEG